MYQALNETCDMFRPGNVVTSSATKPSQTNNNNNNKGSVADDEPVRLNSILELTVVHFININTRGFCGALGVFIKDWRFVW